jgi:hypothetical protein
MLNHLEIEEESVDNRTFGKYYEDNAEILRKSSFRGNKFGSNSTKFRNNHYESHSEDGSSHVDLEDIRAEFSSEPLRSYDKRRQEFIRTFLLF